MNDEEVKKLDKSDHARITNSVKTVKTILCSIAGTAAVVGFGQFVKSLLNKNKRNE